MRSFKKRKSNLDSGFTLIELLVVIIIIGILAGIAVIGVTGAQNAAKSKACTANSVQIAKGLRAYYAATGKFPKADTVVSGAIASPDGNDTAGTAIVQFTLDDLKKLSLESTVVTTQATARGKFLEKLPPEADPSATAVTAYKIFAEASATDGITVTSKASITPAGTTIKPTLATEYYCAAVTG